MRYVTYKNGMLILVYKKCASKRKYNKRLKMVEYYGKKLTKSQNSKLAHLSSVLCHFPEDLTPDEKIMLMYPNGIILKRGSLNISSEHIVKAIFKHTETKEAYLR